MRKYIYSLFFAIVSFVFLGFYSSSVERPNDSFWRNKGRLITHQFVDKNDSISGQEIFELLDSKGLTIWFCRDIHKQVCMNGLCKMIHLWLFWDGEGKYLGIRLPENEVLTKLGHNNFEPTDYQTLDCILKDTSSLLKELKLEILTDESATKNKHEVDVYTGATKPTLSQVVVNGAVYTCYALWHTVYGQSQKTIMDILNKRINQSYLALLFKSENPFHVSLAISSVEKHPEFHTYFYPQIISVIKSTDPSLSKLALDYFEPAKLKDVVIQKKLVMLNVSPQKKYDIIWKFTKVEETSNFVLAKMLVLYKNHKLIDGSLNLILSLIKSDNLLNRRIVKLLNRIEASENTYNQNLIRIVLNNCKKI